MTAEVSSERLIKFLELLGLHYSNKERLILLGGCALNLLGSGRPTLDIESEILTSRIGNILLQANKFDIDRNSVMNHWHDILRQL